MLQVKNSFTTYEFTDTELVDAAKLSTLQEAFIQHQIGLLNMEKNNLKIDTTNILKLVQEEAFLTGQIRAFEFLLEAHQASAEKIKELSEFMVKESKEVETKPTNIRPKPFDIPVGDLSSM